MQNLRLLGKEGIPADGAGCAGGDLLGRREVMIRGMNE